MKLAIASGKGGTGKTTLATNLAVAAAAQGRSVAYLDCDVEEPNGHLFLRPTIDQQRPVQVPVPRVQNQLCNQCGQCAHACQFSAIVCLGNTTIVFPGLCHSCGACTLACPRQAIVEEPREVGVVETGSRGPLQIVQGRLHVGEAKSPPVIRAVQAAAPAADLQIIDAPPGTSCPVVAAVRGADLVVLVTEPTPFGLHDLKLAVETMQQLRLPVAVVINRADAGDQGVEQYCADQHLTVLARLPDDRQVAEAYSRGDLAIEAVPGMRDRFAELWHELDRCCAALAAAPATTPLTPGGSRHP